MIRILSHFVRARLLLIFTCLFCQHILSSQGCDCVVSEVESNSVTPCDIVIGEVVAVSTVTEFWSAINQANNGGGNMTILVEDGTYPMATTSRYPYITASNLVIRSASGNRDAVIITGTGMSDVSPGTEIGMFAVGDNITIADLTIRGVGNHGIAASGDSLFVHNVKVQDAYEQLLKVSNGAQDGADHARVQCSLFEYTAGVGPQWYIGGLDIHNGNYWMVSDNVFKNISSPSVSLAEHAVHFWDESSHNVVERNMIYNCDRGIGFGLGNSPNTGGIIRNNIIYNDGQNIFDDVGIGLETSPDTKVYNNTIHIQYPNAIEYRFAATTGVSIINNLTNQRIQSRNGGQATVNSNVTNGQPEWYRNLAIGDLRLADDIADIVDQGINLSPDVMDDIDRNTRSAESGYDIGAHEYEEVTTSQEVILSEDCISLYPNPNHGHITIDGSLSLYDIDILDQLGNVHQNITSSTNSVQLDVSLLPDGMYFLRIIKKANGNVHFENMIKR